MRKIIEEIHKKEKRQIDLEGEKSEFKDEIRYSGEARTDKIREIGKTALKLKTKTKPKPPTQIIEIWY